jgi:hypothetical protein
MRGGVRAAREPKAPRLKVTGVRGNCPSHPFLWRFTAPTFSAGHRRRDHRILSLHGLYKRPAATIPVIGYVARLKLVGANREANPSTEDQ